MESFEAAKGSSEKGKSSQQESEAISPEPASKNRQNQKLQSSGSTLGKSASSLPSESESGSTLPDDQTKTEQEISGKPERPVTSANTGAGSDFDSALGLSFATPERQSQLEEQKVPGDKKDSAPFLVAGIGASAGGVVALQQFFENFADTKTGIAFVVVAHLSPDFESHLAPIIQATTLLKVIQVTEPVLVQPEYVYVIPPGKQLTMEDGHIRLADIEPSRSRRAPIDLFFRTLAQTHKDWSAAVVLSGTGADGSVGLPRVKELGGVTLAQDPFEAEYGEMPKKSIGTGFVDQVLPVGQIGEWLVEFQQRKRHSEALENQVGVFDGESVTTSGSTQRNGDSESHPDRDNYGLETVAATDNRQKEDGLAEILNLLKLRTGQNFAQYKVSTLSRRVARRIQIHGLAGLGQYLVFLRNNPLEAQALQRDFLIRVTNFFRDRKVWDYVEANVIPALFRDKDKPASNIRVWVAGCATGEEAYTHAILLHEYAARLPYPVRIQIFASDLDEAAIAVAREGIYPETIALDVSPERLSKFFTINGSNFQIKKVVRDTILFAAHNALKDPPFSRVDLISCRNLMIYFNREAQQQLLSLFHFALKPERFLLLGTSETADTAPELFLNFSKNNHIFIRRPQLQYALPLLPLSLGVNTAITIPGPAKNLAAVSTGTNETVVGSTKSLLPAELHQGILELYSPPSVVINENFNIIHVSRRAGSYLEISGGEFSNNLVQLILPDLRMDLRTSLHQAVRFGRAVQTRWIPLGLSLGSESAAPSETVAGQRPRTVRLSVRPVLDPPSFRGYILVVFEESSEKTETGSNNPNPDFAGTNREGGSNLPERNLESSNLPPNTNTPIKSDTDPTSTGRQVPGQQPLEIIEGEFREPDVTSGSPEARAGAEHHLDSPSINRNQLQRDEIYHRLVEELEVQKKYSQTNFEQYEISVEELKASNEELQAMNEELRSATEELETSKEELQAVNEELLSVNHELKLKVEETSLANNNLQNLIGSTNIATIFLDRNLQVKFYTPKVEQLFNILPTDLNRPLAHFTHHLEYSDLYKDSEKVLRHLTPSNREIQTTAGEWYLVSQTPYRTLENYIDGVILTFIEITERKHNEEKLTYQANLLEFTQEAVVAFNGQEEITFWNPGAEQMYGWTSEEVLRKPARDILGEVAWAANPNPNTSSSQSKENKRPGPGAKSKLPLPDDTQSGESIQRHKDGSTFWVESSSRPFFDKNNLLAGYITVLRDVSNRKIADQYLKESEGRFRMVAELVPDLLWQTDSLGQCNWVNQRWLEFTGQTLEGALGNGWLAALHPKDRSGARAAFDQAIELGQPAVWECRVKDQKGIYCWYLVHIQPVKNENGEIVQWLGAATDVNEQRLAQETLERRVQERTVELERLNDSLTEEQNRLAELSTRLLSVQESERRFIARELHDEVGQDLTGLKFILDTALRVKADQKDKHLANGLEIINKLARQISDLSLSLRPAILDEQGLLNTLVWHIDRYTSQTGIEVNFIHKGLDKRLPGIIETTVYRLIQEALTNVARHAGVRKARVQVVAGAEMYIVIGDEGKGFEVAKVIDGHSSTGVSAMQERVGLVGGHFNIESAVGVGTIITINIPLS